MMAATNGHNTARFKEPGRWRQGEIVDVFPYSADRNDKAHPRFYNLHITGCPGTFEDVKEYLLAEHRGANIIGPREIEPGELLAMRKRPVDFSTLTAPQWADLKRDRELTLTWADLTGAKINERTGTERVETKTETDRR